MAQWPVQTNRFLRRSGNGLGLNTQKWRISITSVLRQFDGGPVLPMIPYGFWMVFLRSVKQINIFFKSNKTLAISDFKELTGLSRKTAIPLLEYLDKNHYTIREENVRMKGESIDDE